MDPELIFRSAANYFHVMIDWATSLGYLPGETLFGFPYDWRQTIRYKPTLDRLEALILEAVQSSPGLKIDIVSHSMGSLLFKSLLGEKKHIIQYIRNWIPIGTPWIGGAGVALKAIISGYNLDIPEIPGVGGLSERVANQLELGWPSVFELMPDLTSDAWKENPFVSYIVDNVSKKADSEQDMVDLFVEVNKNNTFERKTPKQIFAQPLDIKLWEHARTTKAMLKTYEGHIMKFANRGINVFNIVGNGLKTRYGMIFNKSVDTLTDLKTQKPIFHEEQGDGTVPFRSSVVHGIHAKTHYYGGRNNHVKLLEAEEILKALRHFVDLSCIIEGPWNVTTIGDQSLPSNFVLNITHNETVISPRDQLLDKEEMAFLKYQEHSGMAKLSKSCLSFTGEIGDGTWEGTRIIGKECQPLERQQKPIPNGKLVKMCVYGFWSKGLIVECNAGFYEVDGQCIPDAVDQPSSIIVIGTIVASLILAALILGFTMITRNKRNRRVSIQYI